MKLWIKAKSFDINDSRGKKSHQYVAEMTAIDLLPFSAVEDLGFIRLLNHINPNYQNPSQKNMKENIYASRGPRSWKTLLVVLNLL